MAKKIKKLLTLEQLVQFCEQNKFYAFNAKDTGYTLSVQVPGNLNFSDKEDEDLLYTTVKVCHTLLNRNGSYISENNMKKAMPTLKYKPLLASIVEDENGELDFNGHDMDINDDGTINYIEKQIGTFTVDEPYLEYDKEQDKTYVMATAVIPREYTPSASIIEKKNGTKVSCELRINEMQYNAKEKYLELTDFVFSGVCCLGESVGEGMLGSRLDIADFSTENNSLRYEENKELLDEIKKLNENLSHFNINEEDLKSSEIYGKEEIEVDNQEILVNEEVVETEEVTEVVANEVVETLEETAVVTEEESTEEVVEAEDVEDPVEDETPEVVEEESVATSESEVVEESTEEKTEEFTEEETVDSTEEHALIEKKFEVDGKKFSVCFELSHDDIRYGLYNLLTIYDELDNEWYGIRAVYNDYFVMQGWCTNKIYGQKYTVDGDTVAFDGERYELFEELLTATEKAELDSMRSNYEALVQFKEDAENAELRAQKEAILYNEKYSVIAEKDENSEYKNASFAKLVSEMDNYSLTDLEKELKSVFADYITNGGQFAYVGEEKPVVSKKMFATSTGKKSSRYGNLFNK